MPALEVLSAQQVSSTPIQRAISFECSSVQVEGSELYQAKPFPPGLPLGSLATALHTPPPPPPLLEPL